MLDFIKTGSTLVYVLFCFILCTYASMFSLSEARILDNDANESNFMTVFNQLTRLNLEGQEIHPRDMPLQDQDYLSTNDIPQNPRNIMNMGGKSNGPRRGGRGPKQDSEEFVAY